MKQIVIVAIVATTVLATGIVLRLFAVRAPGAAAIKATGHATGSAGHAVARYAVIPPRFAGFSDWPEQRRVAAVTALQDDPRLDAETVGFLIDAIRDRRLSELARNNIANGLLIQDMPDARLPGLFLAMVDDPGESLKWREYAVQHLAGTIDAGADVATVVAALRRLMAGSEGSIPGTAMLHLHRLEQSGRTTLSGDFSDLVAARAADPRTDLLVRMTALGLLGERGARQHLPLVRRLVASDQSALRRAAIATLGLIGDAGDHALVAGEVGAADPAVALAARGALERLERRSAP
jgi:hypothetical protein